jgi:ABC-type multidrug transport system ATPase subunit
LLALSSILKKFAARDDRTVLLSVPVPELIEGIADRIAIIKDGHIIAFESCEGLRKLAAFDGPLPEVIERIVHPERVGRVNRYMEGDADVS